jgi:hypothetical protein
MLARWAGKSSWPSTEATREELLSLAPENISAPSRTYGRRKASYLLLTYEVDGQVYPADVRCLDWHESFLDDPKGKLVIQYNPNHPSRYYFAPACVLTSRLIVALLIAVGAAAVALSIHIHG